MTDKGVEKRTGKVPGSQVKPYVPQAQKEQPENAEEIAYQNKDITSKILAETFRGKHSRYMGWICPGSEQCCQQTCL